MARHLRPRSPRSALIARAAGFILAMVLRASVASAGDTPTGASATRPDQPGPLATMPSEPGPHIARIKALGDNAWLDLGSPAADPKWGKGRGRAWSSRMPYAAEMKAAFLFGEGVHGWYNKRNDRYMDDLFVYDVNAHRWVCAYPGSDVKNIALKMDANGFEADEAGQPIPVSQMGHAYEQLTYDPDRRKFMFMPASCSNYQNSPLGERRKTWGGGYPWPFSPRQCSPWMYDVASNKFQLLKTTGPRPVSGLGDVLIYLPATKALFFWHGADKEVWLYEPRGNTWAKVVPQGAPPAFGGDCVACLDAKRGRIYFGGVLAAEGKQALWCYDLKANAWSDLAPRGKTANGEVRYRYGTNTAAMNYDAANDVAVLCVHVTSEGGIGGIKGGAQAQGVYVYDPATNAFSEDSRPLPKGFHPGKYAGCVSSFYSPDLNAHFYHVAGDSGDDGVMWVYRYKQPSAAGK